MQDSYQHFGCNTGNVIVMVISTNHTSAQLSTVAFDGIKIPNPPGNSILSQYASMGVGAQGYPHIIMIKSDKKVVNTDIWPISNTILRNEITTAGGTAQSCGSTGIDVVQFADMYVYPNPANNFLTVDINETASYDVYNLYGVLVKSGIANRDNQIINIEDLSIGNYLIKLYNEKNILGVSRFAVVR